MSAVTVMAVTVDAESPTEVVLIFDSPYVFPPFPTIRVGGILDQFGKSAVLSSWWPQSLEAGR